MIQLLEPSWWLSFVHPIGAWWLACALLGVLALPLTLRVFAGLADRGAGLSVGVGVLLTTWIAWVLAHVGVPHGRTSIRAAGLLVAVASVWAWRRRPREADAAIRATLVPFLVAQALFALGFVYFCNVRSYVPWITFDIGLSGAEKLGNLMHLDSVMRATSMPPRDAWLLGAPTNYYYGGHLLVATLAKLTGTPARFAFNYGLATIFALTLAMGFSLTYSMAVRRGPGGRRFSWHRGMAWGVLGGLAIAVFGNLDAWRQLGRRDPGQVRQELEWRLRAQRHGTTDPARGKTLDRELAQIAALGRERLRWSAANLKQIDYWASSRAIRGGPPGADPGTITEFPYFSAMLGDLHPHHMALPYTIAALAAGLAMLRRNAARRARTDVEWLARCGPSGVALGVAMGAVFPVNIWDTIVLSVLALLVVTASRQGVVASDGWRGLTFAALGAAGSWTAALLANIGARVPALGTPLLFVLALLVAVVGPAAWRRRRPDLSASDARRLSIAAAAGVAAVGGWITGGLAGAGGLDIALAGLRDGVLVALALWIASAVAFAPARRSLTDAAGVLGTYAAVGLVAVLVASPFILRFHSPLEARATLLDRHLPPILSAAVLFGSEPIAARMWSASPINPFPSELRSELTDYLAHWGLFVLPIVALVLARSSTLAARQPRALSALLASSLAIVGATLWAMDRYWTGPLALALAFLCVSLAMLPRVQADAPVLLFAATGFFWSWFVEALHFDDSYGGALERYNTPFKIFYPLWPILAAAMVGALRRLAPRIPSSGWPLLGLLRSPGLLAVAAVVGLVGAYTLGIRTGLTAAGVAVGAVLVSGAVLQLTHRLRRASISTDAPALAAGVLIAALGLLYPFAATATRTRSLFSESIEHTWMDDPRGDRVREFYTRRTLDGFAWLGQTKQYADDLRAVEWLLANAPAGSVVLEAPSHGAYTPEGRISSMTGLPTLVGWAHHENQWRGWAKPMPRELQKQLFDELKDQLPGLELGVTVPWEAQVDLYRASATSRAALISALRVHLPQADRRTLAALADTVDQPRQRTLSAVALTAKLAQRMGDLYRAPTLDDEVRRLLRLYAIRYVFVGSLEKAAFGAAAEKFAVFPRVWVKGGTAIYEVPAEVRAVAARP